MRWRFLDAGADWSEREAKLADIDRWWTEFATNLGILNELLTGGGTFDLAEWMGRTLSEVDARLMWEYGPALHETGHRLVITPEHRYQLGELARTVVARAPEMDGWEFYDRRPPVPPGDAAELVRARTGGSLDGVTVALSEGTHRLIDLRFYSTSPSAQSDAFVAAETLLGEAALNDWVGEVVVSKPRRFGRPASSAVPWAELPNRFEDARRTVLSATPTKPYHELVESAEWSLLELKPEQAADYRGTADLAVAVTFDVDLWSAAHAGPRFASARFSRMGERFVTVKIDGIEGLEGSAFGDRPEIEDALSAALSPSGVGCVVGGGTGVRYSYVDLCFTDIDAGLAAARTCLAAGRVPERTWILFFDYVWSDEWVGVYQSTPPPPTGD